MNNRKHETLGHSVIPSNYRLEIEPGLKGFRFRGRVTITAKAMLWTRMIVLNAKELRIRKASVRWKKVEQKATVSMDKKREQISLRLKRPVRGPIEIDISYEGLHNDRLYGFYRSKYTYKGKEEYIFTTQFEAADARVALPCFDEPEFKATFDVSMLIDRELDAISNNLIKSITNSVRSKKIVTFETSPKMSTYLLYMGVGNFEYLNGRLGKLRLRVVTVPGKSQHGAVALGYAKKIVSFYERYFGIKYPLRKLDLIAVPDFSAGAMENWGAITFRESELLWEKGTGTVASRQEVCSVIAHEMAHQWFGDLVTMAWWEDIWLNESFASFMGAKCENALFPRWDVMAQNIMDHRTGLDSALERDQMKATHPISSPVNKVGDIYKTFDRLSYAKGMNFLGMLEDYMGEGIFREGLHHYLRKHAYSNATKYDLWNALDAAGRRHRAGLKTVAVARDWVEKPGYPIVSVYKTDWAAHFSQRRYTLTEKPADRNELWHIPLHYTTEKGEQGRLLMNRTDTDIEVNNPKWIKLNCSEKGPYRVCYKDGMLHQLGGAIVNGKLSGIDSWGIENDLFSLVRSGRAGMKEYLSFVDSYCSSAKYPMTLSVSLHLSWLRTVLDGTRHENDVVRTSLKYHEMLINELGWWTRDGEKSTDTVLRGSVIRELSMLGHAHTIRKVGDLFKEYRSSRKNKVDPNIIASIFASVAWNGGTREYITLKKMYEKEKSIEVKDALLVSLGFFRKDDIIRKALAYSMSKKVRLQDAYLIPVVVSGTTTARRMMLTWTMKNWRRFMSLYAPSAEFLSKFVLNLAANTDYESLKTVKRFFSDRRNRRPDIENAIWQTIEMIEANINFIRKNQ